MSLFHTVYATDAQVAEYFTWARKQIGNPAYTKLTPLQQSHHLRITGTAAATIMGLNPWQTPDELVAYINYELPEKEQNFAMSRGIALEEAIRNFAVSELNLTGVQKDVVYEHPASPDRADEVWFGCQIDTVAKKNGEPVIVEIKTASRNSKVKGSKSMKWGKGCNIVGGMIVSEDDQIPTNYLMQVQFQMNISGIHDCYLACAIDGENEPRIYHIAYDEQIAEQICNNATVFLFDYVIPNVKPNAPVMETTQSLPDDVMTYDKFEMSPLNLIYCEIKSMEETAKLMQDRIKDLKAQLVAGMGNYKQVLGADSNPIITRTIYTTNRFDTKSFAKEEPELYAHYLVQSNSERLTIK